MGVGRTRAHLPQRHVHRAGEKTVRISAPLPAIRVLRVQPVHARRDRWPFYSRIRGEENVNARTRRLRCDISFAYISREGQQVGR